MALIRWTPLSAMSAWPNERMPVWDPMSEMDRMLESFGEERGRGFIPQLDVYQDADTVTVETPLPGVRAEDVNISIENDVLTIEGQTEKKTEVDEKNYFRKEVRTGSFHRAVALPAAVNGEKASATYENGILKIRIPKEERAKPRRIAVNAVPSKRK